MALLLLNNTYVKIELDGSFTVYKNKAARNRSKKPTALTDIALKYLEMTTKYSGPEYQYYDVDAAKKLIAWQLEAKQFFNDLRNNKQKNHYPLIEQFYPDASKVIPEILETGKFGWASQYSSLEEIYNKVKELEIFGPKETIQDI